MAESAEGVTGVVFAAAGGERWLGMAGGYVHQEDDRVATVWGMWVDPMARGRGLGAALLESVIVWARGRGVVRLELSVSDAAPAAASLYRRMGFEETGERRPFAPYPWLVDTPMAMILG